MINKLEVAPLIERRAGFRYPVTLELSYRELKGKTQLMGQGKTINISSSGLLFASEHPPSVDADVELMLQWPVLLNDEGPLRLKVNGKVMRTEGGRVAIEISQYEFRVSGRVLKTASLPIRAGAIA